MPRLKVKDDTVITINVQHRVLTYDVIKKIKFVKLWFFLGGEGIMGEQHPKGLLAKN